MSLFEMSFNAVLLAVSLLGSWLSAAQVVRNRTVDGLSMMTMSMALWACSGWAVYAVLQSHRVQLVSNVVALVSVVAILVVAHRTGRMHLGRAVASTVTWMVVFAVAMIAGGVIAAGLLLTLLAVVIRVPQTIESWRNPGGLGMSQPANLLGCAQCAAWTIYGWLCADWIMAVAPAYCLAHLGFVVVRTAQGRRKRPLLVEIEIDTSRGSIQRDVTVLRANETNDDRLVQAA